MIKEILIILILIGVLFLSYPNAKSCSDQNGEWNILENKCKNHGFLTMTGEYFNIGLPTSTWDWNSNDYVLFHIGENSKDNFRIPVRDIFVLRNAYDNNEIRYLKDLSIYKEKSVQTITTLEKAENRQFTNQQPKKKKE